MKTFTLFGAALLGLAFVSLNAQGQTTYVQTSKIIGKTVKIESGEEVGVIKDVVIDQSSGCLAYTVVSTGGTGARITGQARLVAVPWSVYSVGPDVSVVTVRVERDRIINAPVFEYSRMSEYSTTGYINNVYSHFGVSAQTGVNARTSTATTSQQTTAGQTQTGAPATTASPAASGTASPMPTSPAAATATATPEASPAETASPKPTPTTKRGATREASPRPKKEATEAPPARRRHASPSPTEGREESTSETTETPSSKAKKSSRRQKTEQSPGEVEVMPEPNP